MDIAKLSKTLEKFAKDRDWEKFHTPKNLIMALTGEVGELNEIFQWLSEKEASEVMQCDEAVAVRHELADIFLYLVRLANILELTYSKQPLKKSR